MTPDFVHVLSQFGEKFELISSDKKRLAEGYAFIQPLTSRMGKRLALTFTPLGSVDEGKYLYLGPHDVDIEPAHEGCILSEGVKYKLLRSERVRLMGGVFHIWAILRRAEECE